jgi:hypothetical protein
LIFPTLLIGTIDGLMQFFENDPFLSVTRINFALQGAFYINWMIQQTWISNMVRLLRPHLFFLRVVKLWLAVSDKEKERVIADVDEVTYRVRFAQVLLVVVVMQTFAVVVPLVLPAAMLCFLVTHIVDKNNILHVFPKDLNSDEMIPTVSAQFVMALLLYEIATLAFFYLKKVLYAFVVVLILLFLTLVFGFFLMILNEIDKYRFVRYKQPELIPWAYPEELLKVAYRHPGLEPEEDDLEGRVNRHLDSLAHDTAEQPMDLEDSLASPSDYETALEQWERRAYRDNGRGGTVSASDLGALPAGLAAGHMAAQPTQQEEENENSPAPESDGENSQELDPVV